MKPGLKAPGTKRLKLNYDKLLSTVAFRFNLRRYTAAAQAQTKTQNGDGLQETELRAAVAEGELASCRERLTLVEGVLREWQGLTLVHCSAQRKRFLLDRGCIWGSFGGCSRGV
jgi:hypothetical protein